MTDLRIAILAVPERRAAAEALADQHHEHDVRIYLDHEHEGLIWNAARAWADAPDGWQVQLQDDAYCPEWVPTALPSILARAPAELLGLLDVHPRHRRPMPDSPWAECNALWGTAMALHGDRARRLAAEVAASPKLPPRFNDDTFASVVAEARGWRTAVVCGGLYGEAPVASTIGHPRSPDRPPVAARASAWSAKPSPPCRVRNAGLTTNFPLYVAAYRSGAWRAEEEQWQAS